MQLRVPVESRPCRAGVEVRAQTIQLAAHGDTLEEAQDALRSAVEAWARALARGGTLTRALVRAGLEAGDIDDPADLDVHLEPTTPGPTVAAAG